MYVPRHFATPDDRVAELLASAETAQLVTAHARGPVATLLPVLFVPAAGGHGSLLFHVMRPNGQWRDPGLGEALAVLSGPDAYVAPEWFASFGVSPGVPTWNYVTVHAYGTLVVHDDPDWVRDVVARLSARFGYDLSEVPAEAVERMLRAVVGLELVITRVEAKSKLSQNKAPLDIEGVIAGLEGVGEGALADEMATVALPHAVARAALVEGVRASRGPAAGPASGG